MTGISFVGSLHPGPVNVTVIRTTLAGDQRSALWLAVGGCLPESLFSGLVAGGWGALPVQNQWLHRLDYLSIPLLMGGGLSMIWQGGRVKKRADVGRSFSLVPPFGRGLALAATNPQLVLFWSVAWVSLDQSRLIAFPYCLSQWLFAGAASTGALSLSVVLIWLTNWQRNQILQSLSPRWLNYGSGSALIGFALVHLYHSLNGLSTDLF